MTAFQMPVLDLAATEIAPRIFRKQILRFGEIPYKGRRLKFDRPYLEQVAASFGKAFDQVPLVFADDDNSHATSPERYRGEVKSVALTEDGIDAIVEMTEEGAELVRKNPRLGVSARLVGDVERDGTVYPAALEHVCGTLNPRLHGMRPWEPMETTSLSSVRSAGDTEGREQVIDLSTSDYMTDKTNTATITDEQLDELKGLSPEERAAKLGEFTASTSEPDDKGKRFSLKSLLGISDDKLTDEDLAEAIKAGGTVTDEKADEKELVASLSDDDRKRIDLAEEKARKADERVAAAEWKAERHELALAGVPPAMLDLAEPVLKSGQKVTIDLSDDSTADASEVIRNLLDAAKGTVDLSTASGSSEDTSQETEAKDLASNEKWEASV